VNTTDVERYASHLPVLEKVCEQHDVRHVLEVGCGHHSTPFFLSLPNLERLVSLETNDEWSGPIRDAYPDDRLELLLVDDAVDALERLILTDFDLVFIDNGDTAAERLEVIRHVLGRTHPIVVVHDAEVPEYRDAIENHTHIIVGVPWTAVIR
jgi:predicted O-methyltransferase YrrM